MLVLLPPSEGKTVPDSGPPLDLTALSLPRLNPARRGVLNALVRVCRTDPGALGILGLSAGQAAEVARNRGLKKAPTAPAWQVYTGVLFAALGMGEADPRAQARLADWVLVWSGLWGAVRLTDPIPAYRLSGSVALPGPGRLAMYWRDPLRRALAEPSREGLIVDLRSGTYAASWQGPAQRTAAIRIIHEQGERRTVASHFNKATKGRLVRALGEADADPATVDELVDVIRGVGFRVEPAATPPGGRGPTSTMLDIVVNTL